MTTTTRKISIMTTTKTEPNYYSRLFYLLKTWHSLEPERCDVLKDPEGEQPDAYFVKRDKYNGFSKVQRIAIADEDVIQGAVQNAIAEHNWSAEVTLNYDGQGGTKVIIYNGIAYDTIFMHKSTMMALLSAYIIALTLKQETI